MHNVSFKKNSSHFRLCNVCQNWLFSVYHRPSSTVEAMPYLNSGTGTIYEIIHKNESRVIVYTLTQYFVNVLAVKSTLKSTHKHDKIFIIYKKSKSIQIIKIYNFMLTEPCQLSNKNLQTGDSFIQNKIYRDSKPCNKMMTILSHL